MADIHIQDIADALAATQNAQMGGKLEYTDLYQDTQEFAVLPRLLDAHSVEERATPQIDIECKVRSLNPARNVGLFAEDAVHIGNLAEKGSINWAHTVTDWGFERREFLSNMSSPRRILDILKMREDDAMYSLAELLEENFFGKPTDSTDDTTPLGLLYWLVRPTSTPDAGFNGGDPQGFTAGCAGLASATYAMWQNWVDTYTNITQDDFVKKARKAFRYCKFKSPVKGTNANTSQPHRWAMYSNYAVISVMEDLLRFQNDNLGPDVASQDGKVMIRRVPVEDIPYLDGDSTNPLIGLDWRTFKVYFLEGDNMHRTKPAPVPGSHNTIQGFIDSTMQFGSLDRKRSFRIYVA